MDSPAVAAAADVVGVAGGGSSVNDPHAVA
jgi:hypothetical protein